MSDYPTGRQGAREDLCRFLSGCFYEPSNDFVEEHLFDSIRMAAEAIDPALGAMARRLGEAFAAQDLESLLVDYTRLFIGPSQPAAMPYASFWATADQSERHGATMQVAEYFARGGFEVGADVRELPDHVAIEMEFLYALTFRLHHAGDGADDVDQADIAALRKEFLTEHIARWIVPFCAAVRAGAATDFYLALADLTEQFVRLEVKHCP